MLDLFFQKNQTQKIIFPNSNFIKVSNNLDSHYYVLERVKNGNKEYLQNYYFLQGHPQIVSYRTSWQEEESRQEEISIKKPKEKKGIMGGLLSKKSKTQGKIPPLKQAKQEQQVKTVVEQILYVQMQAFQVVNLPSNIQEIKSFMALLYLLAKRVFQQTKQWPMMIPVIVESRKYKFVKKGRQCYHQLVGLFNYVGSSQKENLLKQWSEKIGKQLQSVNSQEKRTQILGNLLKNELQQIIEGEYILKMKKGQQLIAQTVVLLNPFTILLKESLMYINIDQYEVTYYHQNQDIRQIVLQHNVEYPIILVGHRDNFIIRYFKQFLINS